MDTVMVMVITRHITLDTQVITRDTLGITRDTLGITHHIMVHMGKETPIVHQ